MADSPTGRPTRRSGRTKGLDGAEEPGVPVDPVAPVVQFLHPGREHVPSGPTMGWNTADRRHARKFLTGIGQLVDSHGEQRRGEVAFWGEWEPPSRIVHRWRREPGLPTVLHEPSWRDPAPRERLHNTDPWVFGDAFLYSNCQQLTRTRRPSGLQHLPRGGLILFGSQLGRAFVLDTVFVVSEVLGHYRPVDDVSSLRVDPAFAACTLAALATANARYARSTFTLYLGATFNDPVHGMYSFVPCLGREDHEARFARPSIDLSIVVNPRKSQGWSGANNRRPMAEVTAAWHEVVTQVRSADLDLAVHLDTPSKAR